MKNKVAVLGIILMLAIGCQRQVEYNVVDMDEPMIVCPDSTLWNYADLEVQLRNIYQKYPWVKEIYIDDTMSVMRINLNVMYKFDHYGWDGRILAVDIIKNLAELEGYCSINIPSREKCLVSINYNNIRSKNNSALTWVKIPLNEFDNYSNPLYQNFIYYILEQMTPVDFQAYDRALKILYAENNDERLNTDFYTLILQLSKDNILSKDEEFILDNLTDWALSKPETETRKHFDYFRNQISKASMKVDAGK